MASDQYVMQAASSVRPAGTVNVVCRPAATSIMSPSLRNEFLSPSYSQWNAGADALPPIGCRDALMVTVPVAARATSLTPEPSPGERSSCSPNVVARPGLVGTLAGSGYPLPSCCGIDQKVLPSARAVWRVMTTSSVVGDAAPCTRIVLESRHGA